MISELRVLQECAQLMQDESTHVIKYQKLLQECAQLSDARRKYIRYRKYVCLDRHI